MTDTEQLEFQEMSEETSVEEEDPRDPDEHILLKYAITSYGADYPVDALVQRISGNNPTIVIPTFQRGYVWTLPIASKFIESLLFGLPVPGIFLARDSESPQLLVIDGQQRLRTLQYFYDGIFQPTGTEFALKGVAEEYEGKTYDTLSGNDRFNLDNTIIHATIVKQDEPDDGNSSMYHIFERLNSGGFDLKPQEIRSAIYHGPFRELLQDLNTQTEWRSIFGTISPRMKDQEFILRFFALYYNSDNYERPLVKFLNEYMSRNRNLTRQSAGELRTLFTTTINIIHACIGTRAFRSTRAINASIFDAVMVGTARRLEQGAITNCDDYSQKYTMLLKNRDFLAITETSTSGESAVQRRLELATEAFADVL